MTMVAVAVGFLYSGFEQGQRLCMQNTAQNNGAVALVCVNVVRENIERWAHRASITARRRLPSRGGDASCGP
jgi:hypothetical protein